MSDIVYLLITLVGFALMAVLTGVIARRLEEPSEERAEQR